MAMAKEAAAHRAGALKQQNKPHKAGKHRVSSARRQGGERAEGLLFPGESF